MNLLGALESLTVLVSNGGRAQGRSDLMLRALQFQDTGCKHVDWLCPETAMPAAKDNEARIHCCRCSRLKGGPRAHLERGDADLERGLRRGGVLALGRSPRLRAGRSLSGDLLRCLAAKPRPWPWPILIASTGATMPCSAMILN